MLKKYKNISRVILGLSIIAVAFMTSSCENDVVDLEPENKLFDQTAYATPERCELAVVGAYDIAQQGKYGEGDDGSFSRGYPFGAASIIQGEMRGEDMNLTAVFYGITYKSTYTTSSANNMYMWGTSFEAINRYNTVMKGINGAVSDGTLTEAKGKQYIGELLFLRALTYHNLMIHFALPYNVSGNNNYGLPLYLTAITTKEEIEAASKIGRSTVEQTYTQILKDLDDAEASFPNTDKNSANKITRASVSAVIALKTRVYLHKRDWKGVITEAKKLISVSDPNASLIGNYKLESSPATPFTSYSDNFESIFSIENNSTDNGTVNGAMSAMFSARSGGRGICTSSPILYNSKYWLKDDKRRDLLMYRSSDKYYFVDKYQNPTTREEYAPIIRYAEVLLNYAEAALRDNDKATALVLLNAVRDRSLADPATQTYKSSDFATTKDFLDAILWERRIEFHGEGRRWEDIHRLANDDISPSKGIPAKIEYNNAKYYKKADGTEVNPNGAFQFDSPVSSAWFSGSTAFVPYTDKRFIWPIPLNDIIRNPTLKDQQNAGW
ncbi:MAG: RagB/SusD family nutrient uptake outer membrane protein [Dysgonomonas sp.]